MSTLQDHIESINRRLSDKYGLICDERSRMRFVLLLRDIDFEIDEMERREIQEANHESDHSSKQSRNT